MKEAILKREESNKKLFDEGMRAYNLSRGLPSDKGSWMSKEDADKLLESLGQGLVDAPSLAQEIAESRWDLDY